LIHIRFQSLVCTAAIRHPFNWKKKSVFLKRL
jgi:hypothetical protein